MIKPSSALPEPSLCLDWTIRRAQLLNRLAPETLSFHDLEDILEIVNQELEHRRRHEVIPPNSGQLEMGMAW